MTAATYPITIEQGADWRLHLTYGPVGSPIDLTGYTAAMKVRNEIAGPDVLMSLTQSDGIALGGLAGTIILTRSAAQTAALAIPAVAAKGRQGAVTVYRIGFYDLVLTSASGAVKRLVQGPVWLSPQVTR